MLDEQAKENVRKDIQTILKTAIVVDSTLDEYGSELCERLERTAEALQKTFEMEDSLMEDFRKALETAREQNSGEPEDFPISQALRNTVSGKGSRTRRTASGPSPMKNSTSSLTAQP